MRYIIFIFLLSFGHYGGYGALDERLGSDEGNTDTITKESLDAQINRLIAKRDDLLVQKADKDKILRQLRADSCPTNSGSTR